MSAPWMLRPETNGTTFKIIDKEHGISDAAIPTAGVHTVYDALAAYAAATRLGLDAARCAVVPCHIPDDWYAPAYCKKAV